MECFGNQKEGKGEKELRNEKRKKGKLAGHLLWQLLLTVLWAWFVGVLLVE